MPRRAATASFALVAAALSCADPSPPAAAVTAPCPEHFASDPERTARIRGDLAAADAASLLAGAESTRPLAFCYGPIARSVVRDDGVLLLDAALPPGGDTARVAHLLQHVVSFPDLDARSGPPCATLVATALDREAHALASEIHLRARARLPALYEFEAPCRAEAHSACARRAREYLEAHPDGAPGIDALATQYLERCTRARAAGGVAQR